MSSVITNKANGEVMIFRRDTASTGGAFLEIETWLPPRARGPRPHVHLRQREEGEVLSGTLAVNVGGRVRVLRPGDPIDLPAGVWHTFWNPGDEGVQLRGTLTPAGSFEPFIRAMWGAANASPSGRPSLFDVAFLAERYRDEFLLRSPPAALQRPLFAVVVALGRRLGTYDAERLARLLPGG